MISTDPKALAKSTDPLKILISDNYLAPSDFYIVSTQEQAEEIVNYFNKEFLYNA